MEGVVGPPMYKQGSSTTDGSAQCDAFSGETLRNVCFLLRLDSFPLLNGTAVTPPSPPGDWGFPLPHVSYPHFFPESYSPSCSGLS